MHRLWIELGASGTIIFTVIIATSVMYCALMLLFVFLGRRIKGADNYYLTTIGILVGAISARASLGLAPTLLTGLVSIATLIWWVFIFDRVNAFPKLRNLTARPQRRAVVLILDGEMQTAALKKYHIGKMTVYRELRKKGITDLSQVKMLILEGRGGFTVVKVGQKIDPDFFADVRGVKF